MPFYFGVIRGPTELFHYGVKGMKWGVRRSKASSISDINAILSTLSTSERKHVLGNRPYKNSRYSVYRKVARRNGVPAGFIEAFRDPDLKRNEAIVITATNKKFRGQGVSKELTRDLVSNMPKGIDVLYWETTKGNKASGRVARSAGFKRSKNYDSIDDNYVYRRRKV